MPTALPKFFLEIFFPPTHGRSLATPIYLGMVHNSWQPRVRIPRGIFAKYITLNPLQHLGMSIRLEGMVAA
jgi:hypothetical protein